MFKNTAIFGLGLLGGSICKSLKKISPEINIHAYGRDITKLKPAYDEGIVDSVKNIKKLELEGIDLVIVCAPVISSIDIINNILKSPSLEKNAIVIDVGSVKEEIVRSIEKNPRADRFIGCHPMAGSEKAGYKNSREDLFNNACVIITPNRFNSDTDINRIQKFWEMIQAKVIILPADVHDLIVAYTSHLPHMAACLLVDLLKDVAVKTGNKLAGKDIRNLVGSGFRDVTRISAGSPDMWTDISFLNRENITVSIDQLILKLQFLRDILKEENIDKNKLWDFLSKIRKYRKSLDSITDNIIVAVDGPAGSGKSSVSKEVARNLGLKYIDSGAVYRAITWYLLKKYDPISAGINLSEEIKDLRIFQRFNNDASSSTFVGETDISGLIRNEEIAKNIGIVSDDPGVRNFVNILLKEWAVESSIIMDGRDIGTIVFPEADVKIFLDANVDVRAKRRVLEYEQGGKKVDIKDVRQQIALRDEQDRSRPYGRLVKADDAIYIDTSDMDKDQVINSIISIITVRDN